MSWVLIETSGVAPQRRTFKCKGWKIDEWVYWDAQGKIHYFNPPYVIRRGFARKEFNNIIDLNEFLKAKGLPTFQQ